MPESVQKLPNVVPDLSVLVLLLQTSEPIIHLILELTEVLLIPGRRLVVPHTRYHVIIKLPHIDEAVSLLLGLEEASAMLQTLLELP